MKIIQNQKLIVAIRIIITVTMLPLGGFLTWILFGSKGLIPIVYSISPFKVLIDYTLALWIRLIAYHTILAFAVLVITMALISWGVKKLLGSPDDNYIP